MRSLLDVKNPMQFDPVLFEQMKERAMRVLMESKTETASQVIVLFTEKENEYFYLISNAISADASEEEVLLGRLREAEDTDIFRMLCVWQDRSVDLPSLRFRKTCCQINPANKDAGIFVATRDGHSVMRLGNTLP